MNKSRIFNVSDIVFASLVKLGKEMLSLKLTGVNNLTDIIQYTRSLIKGTGGTVILKIRNFSQGWALEQPIYIGRN